MKVRLRQGSAVAAAALLLLAASSSIAGMHGVRFSHQLHVEESGISCAECHPMATAERSASDKLLPVKGNCAECHDVEDQSSCGMCHLSEAQPPSCTLVAACEAFPHDEHARQQGECVACHSGIACAESAQESSRPDATACRECHLKDRLKPSDHAVGWEHTHGRRAQLDPESCQLCHTEQDNCTECHHGDKLVADGPHPLAFLYSHAAAARTGAARCASCHRDRRFCIECHAGYGLKPLSHDQSGWLSGAHGADARRHLEQCMTCHVAAEAQETCGSCHN